MATPRLEMGAMTIHALPRADALAFWQGRPKEGLALGWDAEHLEVRFPPASGEETLVINFLWRPQWHAYAGNNSLALTPDEWGRMVVTVPAATREVILRFEPPWRKALLLGLTLQGVALVLSLAGARMGLQTLKPLEEADACRS